MNIVAIYQTSELFNSTTCSKIKVKTCLSLFSFSKCFIKLSLAVWWSTIVTLVFWNECKTAIFISTRVLSFHNVEDVFVSRFIRSATVCVFRMRWITLFEIMYYMIATDQFNASAVCTTSTVDDTHLYHIQSVGIAEISATNLRGHVPSTECSSSKFDSTTIK